MFKGGVVGAKNARGALSNTDVVIGLMHEWKESGNRNDGRAAHAIFCSERNMMGVINSMAVFQTKEQEREREKE